MNFQSKYVRLPFLVESLPAIEILRTVTVKNVGISAITHFQIDLVLWVGAMDTVGFMFVVFGSGDELAPLFAAAVNDPANFLKQGRKCDCPPSC